MEKQNGDDEGREQLTLQQNNFYPYRPLSNCPSVDYPVSFFLFIHSLHIFFKQRLIEFLDVEQQTIMNIVIRPLFFHLNL